MQWWVSIINLRGVYSDTTQPNSTELNSTAWTTVDSVCRSWRHKQKHDWLGCTLFNWVSSVQFSWVQLSCVAINTPLVWRSCVYNTSPFYCRLLIAFRLFGRFFCRMVTCGAHHGEEQSTIESRAKWVGLDRVQSFMLILGRVGFGHFTCGRVKKIGPTSNSVSFTHLQSSPTPICFDNCHQLCH